MIRLTILFIISFSFSTFAQDVMLKLASDVWPPFTDIRDKNSVATDLVEEALHRTGIKLENQIIDFTDVIQGIKKGAYHGSSALWKNDEREDIMLFSAPYLQNQLVLVGLKGANVNARQLTELANRKVAIVESYAYGREVEEASKVRFVRGKSDQENLEQLFNGKVDYILVDDLLIQYLVNYQQKEAAKFLEIGTVPLLIRSLHFAIRKDVPNADQIIHQFNDEIVKMMADGTYNRILHLNWIQADVDGDGQLEMVLGGDHAGVKAPSNSYSVYFQNSDSVSSNSHKYYIDGQIYNDWEEIPDTYKVAPIKSENLDDVSLLKFSF